MAAVEIGSFKLMQAPLAVFWFRRDLRIDDNTGLFHALQSHTVLPIFIFDKYILEDLQDKFDRRVIFIHQALQELQHQLIAAGSSLEVHYGYPEEVFSMLVEKYPIKRVFSNHDYEPYANDRDKKIAGSLHGAGISFHSYKDQVIFEKKEVVKDNGTAYTVFSPYSRKWLQKFHESGISHFDSGKYLTNFYKQPPLPIPTLDSMGFSDGELAVPARAVEEDLLKNYEKQRNFPGSVSTSRIGVHLRFGTVSIRKLASQALMHSATFLNELIWREFYQMILWNFPQVGEGKAFKPEYDRIEWRNDPGEFNRWVTGETGYPIVDAGIRELNETGFMHNRVRMVVASFLTKHLLIDWRWGEAFFAQKLLDFEFASNNGGWQWASGSGCDAAPFFRIFNPYIQTKKFDPDFRYISKWVPEFQEFTYPSPMVAHEFARKRCLEVYNKALAKQ